MFHEVIFRRDACSAAVALEEPAPALGPRRADAILRASRADFHLPRSHAIESHIALNELALMKAAI